ncbi:hypothetical protein ACH4GM_12690 [Streptomyces coeruleorubidus]|uniref:hypothetical protein n=1 Tax=Streptomyces coeruleorubidus TaxID=116188 RepID=UPI003787ACEA
MTWSAVLPGAAARVLRTAAGWCALRVVLLVGGMLVIGLLCGERAYAADGVRALTDGTAGWVSGEQSPPARPDAHVLAGRGRPDAHAPNPRQRPTAHAPAGRIDSRGPRSVSGVGGVPPAGADARTVGERVVRVAGDTGEAVPEGLGETRAKEPSLSLPLPKLPVLSELPAPSDPPAVPKPSMPPTLPDLLPAPSDPPAAPKLPKQPKPPTLPDLSNLPALPELPDLPNLPGPSDLLPPPPAPPTGEVTLPEAPGLPGHPSYPALPGHPAPVPATSDPQSGRTAPPAADLPASVGRTGGAEFAAAGSDTVVRGAEHHAAGWTGHAGHTRPADRTRPSHHAGPSLLAGHGPGGHAPAGRPDDTFGNRTAADNGPSRHGDLHAVTLSNRAPLRLLPGVAARSRAAESRDSQRDIPVFPG